MNKAVIVNNIPYCPKCSVQLANMTGDYKEIIHNGEKYVQFERYLQLM